MTKNYNMTPAAKAARKRYYEKTKDRWRQYAKEKARETYSDEYMSYKRMYSAIKHRAKIRNLELDFDLDYLVSIIPAVCPVLGVPIKTLDGLNSHYSPSVDRFDNNKGYTKENIRVISLRANRLKNDATLEEMKKIVQYMSNYT